MTDGFDTKPRPPPWRPVGFRKLRMIALVVAIMASMAVLVNNGLDIWAWLFGDAAAAKATQ